MRLQLPLLLSLPVLVAAVNHPLPIVDLGYAIHRATSYDEATDSYTFANIRFAAPPTGDLRFARPAPPGVDRDAIQDGKVDFFCPQAGTQNISGVETEDCLFLDVTVPRAVLDGEAYDAPVLFWLYGGGFTSGAKKGIGEPRLILPESPRPVVYVQPNYRLGALGFSAGPSFVLSPNTTANAGLFDQAFALKWVQKYIWLFGGNKDEVTVLGFSSGAGGIMHLLSGFGGHKDPMFKRAIPMSAGFLPTGGHATAEGLYKDFESRAGCSDLSCLRAASPETIQAANLGLIAAVSSQRSPAGPVVDGNLSPDIPGHLFQQGRFRQDIDILVSGDFDEGSRFTNPNQTNFDDAIRAAFPGITPSALTAIQTLYPAENFPSEFSRLSAATGDSLINCHGHAMASSLAHGKRYRMLATMPPGTHGAGALTLLGFPFAAPELVKSFRRMIMNFVVFGDPNGEDGGVGGVVFPEFQEAGQGLEVSATEIKLVDLSGDSARCTWWSTGLYTP